MRRPTGIIVTTTISQGRGELGQFVGESTQSLQEDGIGEGERVEWDRTHEGRNAFCEDSSYLIGRTAACFIVRWMDATRLPA